ncbi:MFS transporter [Nocardiopsis sp. ARC36]
MAGVAVAGLSYPPAFAALTRWYGPRRVRALTFLTLVGGLASTVFAPLTAALEAQVGWRGTYLVLALILALVAVPLHALALSRPWNPARAEDRIRDRTAVRAVLRSGAFWALTTALALGTLTVYAVVVAIVPLMQERGYGTTEAAWALGVVGVGQVLGRLAYARWHGSAVRFTGSRSCSWPALRRPSCSPWSADRWPWSSAPPRWWAPPRACSPCSRPRPWRTAGGGALHHAQRRHAHPAHAHHGPGPGACALLSGPMGSYAAVFLLLGGSPCSAPSSPWPAARDGAGPPEPVAPARRRGSPPHRPGRSVTVSSRSVAQVLTGLDQLA